MSILFVEIIIFIVSLFMNAFLTAAEIALSSFGENKIEELKEKGDSIWLLFSKVHKNPEPYYGTIHLMSITFLICSVIVGFLICAKLINPAIIEPHIGFYNYPVSLTLSFILTILSYAGLSPDKFIKASSQFPIMAIIGWFISWHTAPANSRIPLIFSRCNSSF